MFICVVDNMNFKKSNKGVTLLEVLLVLAIGTVILSMLLTYTTQKSEQTRRDKTIIQMQQILNAGLAYYTNNGQWPVTIVGGAYTRTPLVGSALITQNYLPSNNATVTNLLGGACDSTYQLDVNPTTGVFGVIATVCASANSAGVAGIVAGSLPAGFVTNTISPDTTAPTASTCTNESTCYIASQVNVPGQNLNNARSINFAGVYHHGACVPAPTCPTGMTPTIFVVPVSVSGVNDTGSSSVYPISSFTAYAYGAHNGTSTPGTTPVLGGTSMAQCSAPTSSATNCTGGSSTIDPATKYWRVCLQVITEKGDVATTNTGTWGNYATVAAFTRCAPGSPTPNEPAGSDFTVFTH
jgi:prepilin-type N-terminal cleavage/methylation domain-containing protein